MPSESIPDQKLVDRVLYEVFQQLIVSNDFNAMIDDACTKVFGMSTPSTRAFVRQAFEERVGL